MKELTVKTGSHTQFLEITEAVQRAVTESGIKDGVCTVVVPHTTAGVTINESADPAVVEDIAASLEKLVPWKASYRHTEGNAAAHVKASIMGNSLQVLVQAGQLKFGTWQGIFLCEFDGPRSRKVWVSIQPA